VLATLFMVSAFALGVMRGGGGSSVVSGVKGPAQTEAPQLPMGAPPATPAPATTPTPAAAGDKGKTPEAPKTTPTPTPKPGGGRGGK
jgi:hypothetical protein